VGICHRLCMSSEKEYNTIEDKWQSFSTNNLVGAIFSMQHLLLEQLQQRPLLCDGAMGTLLYARGITFEQCFDELNLTQPERIAGIHREYISAGAQIIETNSFGATAPNLRHITCRSAFATSTFAR
jgi:hypothetical protein